MLAPVQKRLYQALEILTYPVVYWINRCFVHLKRFDHPSRAKTDYVFRKMLSSLLSEKGVTAPLEQVTDQTLRWDLRDDPEIQACLQRLNVFSTSSTSSFIASPPSSIEIYDSTSIPADLLSAVKAHVDSASCRLVIEELTFHHYKPPGNYDKQLSFLREAPAERKIFVFVFTMLSPLDHQILAYRKIIKDPLVEVLVGTWKDSILEWK